MPARSTPGARFDERLPGNPRQGPAGRAAHARVGAGDGTVRDHHLRHLPLRPDRLPGTAALAAGVLLATVLFAAILAINRLFVAERDEGGFDAIRLAPVDASALLAAKAVALLVFLVVLEAIAVPVFALFFLDSAAGLAPLAGVLLLADVGLAITGALISSMAVNSRARDLLVPLLLLPLLVPVIIAAGARPERVLAPRAASTTVSANGWRCSAPYDVTFVLVGYASRLLLED